MAAHGRSARDSVPPQLMCSPPRPQAVAAENYDEAGGLAARVERLRSQHPILPREQRVEEAVADGDWEMAAIFQRDLDAVKANLGLPRFGVGQAVEHAHRTEPPLRGIVLDVDLSCAQSDQWVHAAGVVERAAEQGCPPEECDTDLTDIGRNWSQQCFYTVLTDLDDYVEAPAPPELAAWFVDPRTAKPPAPLYIAESSLKIRHEDAGINHPEANKLFTQHTLSPMRGRVHQPSPALRLWQQQRAQVRRDRGSHKDLGEVYTMTAGTFLQRVESARRARRRARLS